MKSITLYKKLLLQGLLLLLLQSSVAAQGNPCNATTLEEFFNCYGGQSAFSAQSIAAVTTFIEADAAQQAGNYAQAKAKIDNLFNTYPRGSNIWWNVFNDPNGANIGTPHAYYGLRMLEDIIEHGLNGNPNITAKKAKMKVVLVGCSEGIQPTTDAELLNGTGQFVTHDIDPSLKADDYRIIRQSFELFSKYVTAITKGALAVEIEFVELDALCLPVGVTTTQPYLAYSGIEPVWAALSAGVKDSTDWWSIVYPSHVPEFPAFDDDSFITGGMGVDYKGGPVFISDDKWIVRKPAHLGAGNYSDIERRIYLPQWVQHEFFHHLYRIYPELALEVNGHDWFDLNFWPSDFEGQFESDYYSETLHKRLQVNCAPLASRLITRVQGDLAGQYSTFSMDELIGPYSLDVVQNPWHEGNIINVNGAYFWKNSANVQWSVTPNFAEGRLETGNDSPYPDQDFFIELYRTTEGDNVPGAAALKFNTESYKKRFNLIRETAPMEIVLGDFERVPNQSTQHTGSILKTAGQFNWLNDAGDDWSLLPNTADENFGLGAGSPTPAEKFQLILAETECDIHALGFKYLGHYYWKPKRIASNAAPNVVNSIPDLELIENFGTHTINLAEVFGDSEGDSLLLFVTSENPALISADINSQQLLLSGDEIGSTTIYVMALDVNGGLAVDQFNVLVKAFSSTHEAASKITVYPRLTQDFVYVEGASTDNTITLFSMDKSYQRTIAVSGSNKSIDLSHLPAGMYLLLFTDSKTGSSEMVKVVKQ